MTDEKEALLLYVSSPECHICKELKPKIIDLVQKKFPKLSMYYIDAEKNPEVAGQLKIFGFPTLLVFFDNKEYIRLSRHFGLEELNKDLSRLYHLYYKK